EGLRAIVMRALAKQPGERYATMREMGAALARVNSLVFPIADGPDFIETPGVGDLGSAPVPSPSTDPGVSHRSGGVPRLPARPSQDEPVAVGRKISPPVLAILGVLLAVNGVLLAMRVRRSEAPAPRIEPPPVAAVVAPPTPPQPPPTEPAPANVDISI